MQSLPEPASLASLLVAADPVSTFLEMGGTVRFTCGTNYTRLRGIAASSTVSERDAVLAWVRTAERKAVRT